MMNDLILERLGEFKVDLGMLSPLQVVRKHVIHGNCCILSQGQYLDLRCEVADFFHLHPNEVLVVGSAKLGFSIAPKKRYRPFCDRSDIDVAIVSPVLFDRVWEAAYKYNISGGYWERSEEFKDYHFRGWIRPDMLPRSRMFPIREKWWEFFRVMTESGRYGGYKIAGALYRSWYYLEDYQIICAQQCQQELGG